MSSGASAGWGLCRDCPGLGAVSPGVGSHWQSMTQLLLPARSQLSLYRQRPAGPGPQRPNNRYTVLRPQCRTRQGTRGLQSSQTSSGAGARAQISSTESADHALSPHSPVSEYPRSVPTFPGRAEPGRARTTVTQLGIGSAAREHTDPDQGLRVRLMARMGLGFKLH